MDLSARKYSFIQELFYVEEATFEKLEILLRKDKIDNVDIPVEHKVELNGRLEMYRNNPNDLLDWDDVKEDW